MTITLEDIDFGFDKNILFDHFNLTLNADGNPLLILGGSGCGKTTLLRIIAGLIKPPHGRVLYSADNQTECMEAKMPKVSFVFQEDRLIPNLSVLENVLLPLKNIFSHGDAEKRALHFLHLNDLDNYFDSYPNELSGGQAQRVSIARAWAYPAPLILMDEPFKSLDIPLRISLMDTVRNLIKTEERFVIAVSHDPREAVYLGKRIIVLGKKSQHSGTKILLDKCGEQSQDFICTQSVQIEKVLIDAME